MILTCLKSKTVIWSRVDKERLSHTSKVPKEINHPVSYPGIFYSFRISEC